MSIDLLKRHDLNYLISHLDDISNLKKIYNEVKVPVYNFALSILKNPIEAEDVVQDVMIKIHSNYKLFKGGNGFSWILTITKNESLMRMRKNEKIELRGDEFWNSIHNGKSLSNDDMILLDYLLNSLSDEEKEIVFLIAISGLKNREVADFLSMPLATVLSKYHRAMKKMQKLLVEEEK